MFAQILAVAIFLVMFILIIVDKIERHIVTLVSAGLTLALVFGVCMHSAGAALKTLNIQQIFTLEFWYEPVMSGANSSGVNWATIVFIAGMMIMVEGMAKAGFFRWMCMAFAKAVRYQVIPLFLLFMVLSAVLSMFIASITVILFLAAVTVELAQLLRFDPIPMILAEVFCANLGGSATMCGDPPNIIIGTSLGYSFGDFILNIGVIAGVSLIATLIYFYLVYHKQLRATSVHPEELTSSTVLDPKAAIQDKRSFALSWVVFLVAVVLLITHAYTGLTVALIGTVVALLTLLTSWRHALDILKGVDYKTLLFFVGLFIVVGGLEQTGILELLATFIGTISGGSAVAIVLIIMRVSAIASAFVDNVPFAATMVPVIKSLSATTGADLSVLAWSLSMGTDVGGSATPIGASANVVGTSVASKEGFSIGWGRYCKVSAPATVVVLLIASICMILRYF